MFRPWEVLGSDQKQFDRFKPYWKCCRTKFTPEPAISIPLEARSADPLPSSWYLPYQDPNIVGGLNQKVSEPVELEQNDWKLPLILDWERERERERRVKTRDGVFFFAESSSASCPRDS